MDCKYIEEVIVRLEHEIFHVHSVQLTFERLYWKDEETRDLLRDSDAAVFLDLQIVYLNYVSMVVARLFDPSYTGKKKNLSLFYLIECLKDYGYVGYEPLLARLEECKRAAYNFTEPRNQLIAHLDFDVNFSKKGKAIPSYLEKEFNATYAEISAIMNEARSALGLPPTMFDWGITGHGHGRKLLSRLAMAKACIEKRLKSSQASLATVAPAPIPRRKGDVI